MFSEFVLDLCADSFVVVGGKEKVVVVDCRLGGLVPDLQVNVPMRQPHLMSHVVFR